MGIYAHFATGLVAALLWASFRDRFGCHLVTKGNALKLPGTILVTVVLMIVPYAIAMYANAYFGFDDAMPFPYIMPHLMNVYGYMAYLKQQGVNTDSAFGVNFQRLARRLASEK